MARPTETSGNDLPRLAGGGSGARAWELETPLGMRVVKVADPARARREAQTLEYLAGSGLAPRLVVSGDGILITERVAGRPLPPARWSAGQAAALGRLLHRLHELPVPSALGGDLTGAACRDAQLAEIRRDCVPQAWDITEAAIAALPAEAPGRPVLLHGDPWSGNVVWGDAGPVLVDWEYARPGEAAQDLAYLAALDELPAATLEAILGGYRADAHLVARVDAWRPLMAAWCGSWFTARGEADRGAHLAAHAERLLRTRGLGG